MMIAALRNEDIAWLVNDSAAALGERGASVDPSGGSSRTLADNWKFIEAAHRAMGDVRRTRRLMQVWFRIRPRHQHVLAMYYTVRRDSFVFGATVGLSEFAGVAVLISREREALVSALSNMSDPKNRPIVTRAKAAGRAAVKAAHEAWEAGSRGRDDDWSLGL